MAMVDVAAAMAAIGTNTSLIASMPCTAWTPMASARCASATPSATDVPGRKCSETAVMTSPRCRILSSEMTEGETIAPEQGPSGKPGSQVGRSSELARRATGGPSTSPSRNACCAARGEDNARRRSSRLFGPRWVGLSPGRTALGGLGRGPGGRTSGGTVVRTRSGAGIRISGGAGRRSWGGGAGRTSGELRRLSRLAMLTRCRPLRWPIASGCRLGRFACGRGPSRRCCRCGTPRR